MPPSRSASPVTRRFLAPLAMLLVALPAAAAIQVTATAERDRVAPGTEVRLTARVQDPDRPGQDPGGVRWEALDGQVHVQGGLFRAPLTVLRARTFTLRATSLVDATAFADVAITVDPAAPEAAWSAEQIAVAHALDMVRNLTGESKEGTWSHRGLPFLDVDTGNRYTAAKLQSIREASESDGPRRILPYGLPVNLRLDTPTSGVEGALLSVRGFDETRRFPAEDRKAVTLALESRVAAATLEVLTRDADGLHSHLVPLDLQVRGLVPLAGHAAFPGTDDGPQAEARFRSPSGLVRHGALGVVVADAGAHTLRTVTGEGEVATLCGLADQPGFANGEGSAARFRAPSFLALDENDAILVADSGNHAIRRVEANGTVRTVAGTGLAGAQDGPGAQATFHDPRGLAVNPATGVIYVADGGNRLIRAIQPDGEVVTLAGTGEAALADGPGDQASFLDLKGMVFFKGYLIVADGPTLRTVDAETGTTATLVGAQGNPGFTPFARFDDVALDGPEARLGDPHGLSLDDLYLLVTDRSNHAVLQLRLPDQEPLLQVAGPASLSVLAGGPESGTFRPGLLREGFPGTLAPRHGALEAPLGAVLDGQGGVVIATGTQVAVLSKLVAERTETMDLALAGPGPRGYQDDHHVDMETGVPLDLAFHFRRRNGSRMPFAQPLHWMAEVIQAGQAGPERVAWVEETAPRSGGRVSILLPRAGNYHLHVAWVMPDGHTYLDVLPLRAQGEPVETPAAITLVTPAKDLPESKG